jgi:hypothetical protein
MEAVYLQHLEDDSSMPVETFCELAKLAFRLAAGYTVKQPLDVCWYQPCSEPVSLIKFMKGMPFHYNV